MCDRSRSGAARRRPGRTARADPFVREFTNSPWTPAGISVTSAAGQGAGSKRATTWSAHSPLTAAGRRRKPRNRDKATRATASARSREGRNRPCREVAEAPTPPTLPTVATFETSNPAASADAVIKSLAFAPPTSTATALQSPQKVQKGAGGAKACERTCAQSRPEGRC